jgi:hypothetical protein
MRRANIAAAVVVAGVLSIAGTAGAAPTGPTCSDTLGVEVHAQHIIGDYVTGVGRATLGWPPNGQVGDAVGGSGPAVTGGPGPGFHFLEGFPPGASFCNPQAHSSNALDHQQATKN